MSTSVIQHASVDTIAADDFTTDAELEYRAAVLSAVESGQRPKGLEKLCASAGRPVSDFTRHVELLTARRNAAARLERGDDAEVAALRAEFELAEARLAEPASTEERRALVRLSQKAREAFEGARQRAWEERRSAERVLSDTQSPGDLVTRDTLSSTSVAAGNEVYRRRRAIEDLDNRMYQRENRERLAEERAALTRARAEHASADARFEAFVSGEMRDWTRCDWGL